MANPQYGEHGQCEASARSTGERCKRPAVGDHGKCDMHGGKSPSGLDHADFEHGAFSKHLTSDLSDAERAVFADARDILESPEGAQDVARSAAALCLVQFRRTGHERFLRRFEGLCDTFGIAPDDELSVTIDGAEEALLKDVRRYHDERDR